MKFQPLSKRSPLNKKTPQFIKNIKQHHEQNTISLIAGGTSGEREVSLKGAAGVEQALNKEKYEVVRYDPAIDLARLAADAEQLDAASFFCTASTARTVQSRACWSYWASPTRFRRAGQCPGNG